MDMHMSTRFAYSAGNVFFAQIASATAWAGRARVVVRAPPPRANSSVGRSPMDVVGKLCINAQVRSVCG